MLRSRQLNRVGRRDPLTEREARQQARVLLDAADKGDVDAANVLLDVLLQMPGGSEVPGPQTARGLSHAVAALAHALRGRTYPAGDALPDDAARARNLQDTLIHVRYVVFPPRRSPCMPNRAELLTLFEAEHGGGERQLFNMLWTTLQEACDSPSRRASERAMDAADDVLRGHGVEELRIRTRRGGTRRALYVNFGDPYVATLIWDEETDRFRVTSWSDVVEGWERRFGRTDEEPDYE